MILSYFIFRPCFLLSARVRWNQRSSYQVKKTLNNSFTVEYYYTFCTFRNSNNHQPGHVGQDHRGGDQRGAGRHRRVVWTLLHPASGEHHHHHHGDFLGDVDGGKHIIVNPCFSGNHSRSVGKKCRVYLHLLRHAIVPCPDLWTLIDVSICYCQIITHLAAIS